MKAKYTVAMQSVNAYHAKDISLKNDCILASTEHTNIAVIIVI